MRLDESIKKLSESLGLNAQESDEELDLSRLQESSSESELDSSSDSEESGSDEEKKGANGADSSSEEEEEEDIALSDAEVEKDADVVPYQKVTINNVNALQKCLKKIALPQSAYTSFVEHLSYTSPEELVLKDIHDDTERELAFYKQALNAAVVCRKKAKQADIPFDRPVDYFAEMVKSDEHMTRLKNKLIEEEKEKLGIQEARKQRELKKYGKKVQHEKLQQRQKEKREMLDKVNNLKRKNKDVSAANDDFDVQLDDAIGDKKKERDQKYKLGNKTNSRQPPNRKRLAKNSKFGSGHKRGERKNTSESSMDLGGYKNKRRR